jgi:hypothetical protein
MNLNMPWDAESIRYIKLGEKGRWAEKCFEDNVLRFGFHTGMQNINELCLNAKWDAIHSYWIERVTNLSTATSYTNQVKSYYEDVGKTLWIAIEDGYLYYGFTVGNPIADSADKSFDGEYLSSHKNMDANGWRRIDNVGNELKINELSSRLTKVVGYQSTTCGFDEENTQYLKNRLRGKFSPVTVEVAKTIVTLKKQIIEMLKQITPKDFELLVQLIFANSGWRQLFATGGTRKTVDLEIQNPVTGDVAFVQVKSTASTRELKDYFKRAQRSYHGRMFFVYHTGIVDSAVVDETVNVWDANKVAEQVIENGLIDWLVNKVK